MHYYVDIGNRLVYIRHMEATPMTKHIYRIFLGSQYLGCRMSKQDANLYARLVMAEGWSGVNIQRVQLA